MYIAEEDDSVPCGYDVVSVGNIIPTFRDNIVS
jgi:hypothetical protein